MEPISSNALLIGTASARYLCTAIFEQGEDACTTFERGCPEDRSLR